MKPKVLFSASTYSHIRNFHLPYLRQFQNAGWTVCLACGNVPDSSPYTDKLIALPFEKKMHSPSNFRAASILRRELTAQQYDLIITHTSLAAFFTRLAAMGLRSRPRIINMSHGYLFDDNTPVLKRHILLAAERLTSPCTDLLLTMNHYDYAVAQRHKLGHRIENVPGIGVDFSRLQTADVEQGQALRRDLGLLEKDFMLIYAAEFSGRKSQHVLIRAMVHTPKPVVLVLPGQGALLNESKALAAQLGVKDRVIFPGYVDNMPTWYTAADAAVSSSRSEGLPFNIMEAMHLSLPVVASAVKGHTDLITHEETGLLYPYGDHLACAKEIQRLYESPDLRYRLAANAQTAVQPFGLDRVLPIVMEQYGVPVYTAEPVAVGVK